MKHVLLNISLMVFFLNPAQSAEHQSKDSECSDDIFLPAEVFKFKGPNARSVWLGVTNIPDDLKEYAASLGQKIKKLLPNVNGRLEPHFHITLKYLGKIGPELCSQKTIAKALKNVLVFPMKLIPSHLKILNNPDGSPRLIALSFESPNLKLFKMSVENALSGFTNRDSRDYWVHMTIYHFPSQSGGKPFKLSPALREKIIKMNVEGGPFKVRGFEFVQSGRTLKTLESFGEKALPTRAYEAPPSLQDEEISLVDKPSGSCDDLMSYWLKTKDLYNEVSGIDVSKSKDMEKIKTYLSEAILLTKEIIIEMTPQTKDDMAPLCAKIETALIASLKLLLRALREEAAPK